MYENEIKNLKKFIRPSPALFIMGVFFAILGLIAILSFVFGSDSNRTAEVIIGGVFGVILGIIMSVAGISNIKKSHKRLTQIDQNGGTPILINDFKSGGKAFKDSLILGQTFLIGKHTGTVITYNDIIQIYQYVHKTNYVEDSRTLKVVLAQNRKTVDLCNIPLRGKGDDEVMQVINYILSKNQNVKVGYK